MTKIPQIPGAAAVSAAKSAVGSRRGAGLPATGGSPGRAGRSSPAMPASPKARPVNVKFAASASGGEVQHSALAENVEARWERLHSNLKEQAAKASEQIAGGSHKIEIAIDEHSRRFVMKVIDADSGHVVRQFPPESILKVSERLDELSGMLLAKEA